MNSELNDAILHDLAIQYYVCQKRFGDKINTFNVVLRTDEEVEKWSVKNMKDEVTSQLAEVQAKIEVFKNTLEGYEPVVPMGDHYRSPYECEFIAYCMGRR